ncbi:hypothetical protein C1Y63_01230 [Corynebacterium sp. 13CS0277]|uniref:hypothetical protein n=1 Tax=Corynebacterium sp. 13CS0277 TaxID=2071994 RepID=UPI000D0344B5|nr:hypothetical protein [Corynebacterium sp. 13CS0277]PRQ12443.1 hypothetical protein C1Y63_01230 [Corynebacterium sp. 13CS0277]
MRTLLTAGTLAASLVVGVVAAPAHAGVSCTLEYNPAFDTLPNCTLNTDEAAKQAAVAYLTELKEIDQQVIREGLKAHPTLSEMGLSYIGLLEESRTREFSAEEKKDLDARAEELEQALIDAGAEDFEIDNVLTFGSSFLEEVWESIDYYVNTGRYGLGATPLTTGRENVASWRETEDEAREWVKYPFGNIWLNVSDIFAAHAQGLDERITTADTLLAERGPTVWADAYESCLLEIDKINRNKKWIHSLSGKFTASQRRQLEQLMNTRTNTSGKPTTNTPSTKPTPAKPSTAKPTAAKPTPAQPSRVQTPSDKPDYAGEASAEQASRDVLGLMLVVGVLISTVISVLRTLPPGMLPPGLLP